MQGLNTARSSFSPQETMDRFEAQVRAKGMTVFCRIDHAAGAHQVGLELLPAEVLIFGNARAGTRLMQLSPTSAIDLPLKALVWENAAHETWLAYNEPESGGSDSSASHTQPGTSSSPGSSTSNG